MITQFPIMSLLSQSTELRNEAMLVHLRNMEHPDAYLSFVF